jgi:hypothetical protein
MPSSQQQNLQCCIQFSQFHNDHEKPNDSEVSYYRFSASRADTKKMTFLAGTVQVISLGKNAGTQQRMYLTYTGVPCGKWNEVYSSLLLTISVVVVNASQHASSAVRQ